MQSASLILAAAAVLGIAVPVGGAELRTNPTAVVELFTSQGCSSCPAADALFADLATRPDIIALAYHVDYWDYIGWPDTFGAKANTDRQKAYAQGWGSSRIYTPQLVVNGETGVVGSRRGEVDGALKDAHLSVPVGVKVGSDMLVVDVGRQPGSPEATVWLITYKDHAQVTIERGENAGRVVDYRQIVTGRQVLGMWEPDDGTHFKLPLNELMAGGSNGAVILVQEEKNGLPGDILGAASVQL